VACVGLTASVSSRYGQAALRGNVDHIPQHVQPNRCGAILTIPKVTDEELAQSKFTCAHNLWLGGNVEAARRWLERLVKEYPATETADRAKITLAKL
jgi:hypothetical protein